MSLTSLFGLPKSPWCNQLTCPRIRSMVSSVRVRLGLHQLRSNANSLAWDRQRSRLIPLSPWPATAAICDPRPSQRHRQNYVCLQSILRQPPHGGAASPIVLGRSSLSRGDGIKPHYPNAPVSQYRTSHLHIDLASRKPHISRIGCRVWPISGLCACGVVSGFK